MSDQAVLNTDREIWRERYDDYYADSIHVTERGGIGINCGGMVYVKPVREWHKSADTIASLTADVDDWRRLAETRGLAIEDLISRADAAEAENERLMGAVEDAIDTLEAMDLHVDNPLYERLCAALQSTEGARSSADHASAEKGE